MSEEKTVPKTLWSETQLEVLYETLKKRRPDHVLLEILVDLRARGFNKHYLLRKIEKHTDPESLLRVKRLFGK